MVDDQNLEPREGENTIGLATCKHCAKTPVYCGNAGFWGWELYNPTTSFRDLMKLWVSIKGDRSKTKAFHNNRLARTFREVIESQKMVDPEHLAARAEPDWAVLPQGVDFATAGVDVQDNRLEIETVGWSLDEESWSISYDVLMGSPAGDGVWLALDELLKRTYEREGGKQIPVSAVAIDSGGHHAATVTNFCRVRQKRRVWAIKSLSERKGTRKEYIWPRSPSISKVGCPVHSISSGGAKDRVEMHLSKTDPGPGYMHIPASRDKTWYDQFLSEHRVFVDLGGGRMGSHWAVKPGKQRNEAWDCRVYALAAVEGLRVIGAIPMRGAPGIAAPKPKSETTEGDERPTLAELKPRRVRRSVNKNRNGKTGW